LLVDHEWFIYWPQSDDVFRKAEPGKAGDNSLLSLSRWRIGVPGRGCEDVDDAEENENLEERALRPLCGLIGLFASDSSTLVTLVGLEPVTRCGARLASFQYWSRHCSVAY
jgi:hypothetical protein